MQPSPQSQSDRKSFVENIAAWIGRLLILVLLVYSPWNYGMVSWNQQVLLCYWSLAISLATLIVLLVRSSPVPSANPLFIVLIILLGFGIIQTLPLPVSIFDLLSPAAKFDRTAATNAAVVLPIDHSQLMDVVKSERQQETTLSINPVQTRCSISIFAAAIAILLCSAILFNDKLSRIVLMACLCSTSTAVAVLGIYQSVSWDSWTLLAMPTDSYFATFVSRNSAPQYLSIGIGCALALIGVWKKVKDKRREKGYNRRYPATTTIAKIRQVLEGLVLELDAVMVILLATLVIHIVAVVAAASRGGIVALFFSTGVCLLFFLADNRRWVAAGLVGFVSLALVSSLALDLFELDDQVFERMQHIQPQGRLDLWANSFGLTEYWVTGSGMGTYRFAIMPVNPFKNAWPHHAESIYVEIAVEFGLASLLLALLGLTWFLARLLPTNENRDLRMWPAALYCVLAISLHNTVDFSLMIPAIFLPLATIIGAFLTEAGKKMPRSHSLPRTKGRWVPALTLVGLIAVIANGHNALAGFAQAERLAKWSKNEFGRQTTQSGEFSESSPSTNPPDEQFDYAHPEVVLELSRNQLARLEASVRKLPNWPSSLPEAEQKLLSSPQLISAILRSNSSDPAWQSRKEYFESHPTIAQQLTACNAGFQFASKACRLDWRAALGEFQSRTKRNLYLDGLNWSRLDSLCSTASNTQQVLASCCIIAGDKAMGIASWKSAVARDPTRAAGISSLVGTFLSFKEVLAILEDNPLAHAELCRSLSSQSATEEMVKELLSKIDQSRLFEVANDDKDWELVSWVAETLGDFDGVERALDELADRRPFDVAIRFKLAQLLEKKGLLEDAIKHLEKASRRTNLPQDVQRYLMELRIKQNTPPASG